MTISKDQYSQFCREHPEMPVFFQDWYLDAVCEDGEWSALMRTGKGKTEAVWPFFMKRKYGFRYITMPLLAKYMGPWPVVAPADLSAEHQLWQDMLAELPRVDAFLQNFHYTQTNWLPWYWAGYAQRTHYTYLLDIRDLDAVFKGVNRNMRRNILKAQQTVQVIAENDPERFFPVNALSFSRKGLRMPYSKALFLRHDAALAGHRQRQMFFAVDAQGRTHAAAYLIWDSCSAYYHLSGDDPAFRQSGAGILLVWEAIRYAREALGLEVFDFEGSMLPEVEAIRRQFGAAQTAYSFIWKYHSPLLRILKR